MSMQLSKLADSDSNCSLARQRILSISIIITTYIHSSLAFCKSPFALDSGACIVGVLLQLPKLLLLVWQLETHSFVTSYKMNKQKQKSGRLPKMAAYTTVCAVSLDSVQAFRGLVSLHCTGKRFLKLASWLCTGRGSCQKKNCKSRTRFGPEWIRDGFCMILHYTCLLSHTTHFHHVRCSFCFSRLRRRDSELRLCQGRKGGIALSISFQGKSGQHVEWIQLDNFFDLRFKVLQDMLWHTIEIYLLHCNAKMPGILAIF